MPVARHCGKSWREWDAGANIAIIQQLHDGMISVTMSVKQGCIFAPTLFISRFAAMIEYTLSDSSNGVYLPTHTDGGIFNLARLRA